MQLQYRGCSYNTPNASVAQSKVVLTYRGVKYQRGSQALQFANPQGQTLTYRGAMYSGC